MATIFSGTNFNGESQKFAPGSFNVKEIIGSSSELRMNINSIKIEKGYLVNITYVIGSDDNTKTLIGEKSIAHLIDMGISGVISMIEVIPFQKSTEDNLGVIKFYQSSGPPVEYNTSAGSEYEIDKDINITKVQVCPDTLVVFYDGDSYTSNQTSIAVKGPIIKDFNSMKNSNSFSSFKIIPLLPKYTGRKRNISFQGNPDDAVDVKQKRDIEKMMVEEDLKQSKSFIVTIFSFLLFILVILFAIKRIDINQYITGSTGSKESTEELVLSPDE